MEPVLTVQSHSLKTKTKQNRRGWKSDARVIVQLPFPILGATIFIMGVVCKFNQLLPIVKPLFYIGSREFL